MNCAGDATGTFTLFVTGGMQPYSYEWHSNDTGDILPIATNSTGSLPAGKYYIVVTDANGCSKTYNFTISQPPRIF